MNVLNLEERKNSNSLLSIIDSSSIFDKTTIERIQKNNSYSNIQIREMLKSSPLNSNIINFSKSNIDININKRNNSSIPNNKLKKLTKLKLLTYRQEKIPLIKNYNSKNKITSYRFTTPHNLKNENNLPIYSSNRNILNSSNGFTKIKKPLLKNFHTYYLSGIKNYNNSKIITNSLEIKKNNSHSKEISPYKYNKEFHLEIEKNFEKINKLAKGLYLKKNNNNEDDNYLINNKKSSSFKKSILRNCFVSSEKKINQKIFNKTMRTFPINRYKIINLDLNKKDNKPKIFIKKKIFEQNNTNKKNNKNLLSSFKSLDDAKLYQKIFVFYNEKKAKKKPPDIVNNLYNIIYAENNKDFFKNIYKRNEKLKKELNPEKKFFKYESTDKKIHLIQDEIGFMKRVVDYAYPEMVYKKTRKEDTIKYKSKSIEYKMPPFKYIDLQLKNFQKNVGLCLSQSLKIIKP